MAKKKRHGRGKKAIPIVQTVTVAWPSVNAFRTAGLNEQGLRLAVFDTVGVDPAGTRAPDIKKGIVLALILLGESTIGRTIANKVGANKLVKKATGNMLQLM